MILFYVVYRVFLLSLTKSILEKKRKRAVFHKLNYFLQRGGRFGSKKRQISREREREQKKRPKKKTKEGVKTPSPLLEETTTTGVDDELEGAAEEISLGADAHAPMILFYV